MVFSDKPRDNGPSNDSHHSAGDGAPAPFEPIADEGQGPLPGQRQLVLNKRGQRHVFRYDIGQEATFIRGIQALAAQPDSDITWFDAAVLSHQMGQWLGRDMRKGA